MTIEMLNQDTAAMPAAPCPHCGNSLKVSWIPARGNCPIYEGGLHASIHALNERCKPDADHQGFESGKLGWDDDGSSHSLVAASFIVPSHNRVPPKVYFRAADGRRFTRRVTHNARPGQALRLHT